MFTVETLGMRLDVHGPAGLTGDLQRLWGLRKVVADKGDSPLSLRWRSLHFDDRSTVNDALARITEVIVRESPLLGIHAGVVGTADGAIAFPGHSGLGKTTLTACIVRSGYTYRSDEVLAIDRTTLLTHPFPRPFGLGPGSWPVLGLPPETLPSPESERLLPAEEFGPVDDRVVPVTDIVLAVRDGSIATLTPLRRGLAVERLLELSFNHYTDPAGSFRAAVGVVRNARVWAAHYGDAPDLSALLHEVIPPA
jgi:hypothetical protein